MTLGHGLALGVIGCTVTFIGFFIAFLVINHNKRKELKKIEDKEFYKWYKKKYLNDTSRP